MSSRPTAALSFSYTSQRRPVVSLDEPSALECAVIGATATTKSVIASTGTSLRALSPDDLTAAVETVRAFSDAARRRQSRLAAPRPVQHRALPPSTNRHQTGHDPRTFTGLVDLVCISSRARMLDTRPPPGGPGHGWWCVVCLVAIMAGWLGARSGRRTRRRRVHDDHRHDRPRPTGRRGSRHHTIRSSRSRAHVEPALPAS
jgi:hypothetical protein